MCKIAHALKERHPNDHFNLFSPNHESTLNAAKRKLEQRRPWLSDLTSDANVLFQRFYAWFHNFFANNTVPMLLTTTSWNVELRRQMFPIKVL